MEQIIVSIGRKNGSGGRDIASRIARKMNVELYDVLVLSEVAKEFSEDMDPGELLKYEEAPKRMSSRRVRGHTNSIEEILAQKQFDYIKKLADRGESFVILGRCADYVLRDCKGLIKIFVDADDDKRIERIAVRHNVDEAEAAKIIKKTDKGRKKYYESHTDGLKWGEAGWYDIVINSSRLGIDKTANYLYKYVTEFKKVTYGS